MEGNEEIQEPAPTPPAEEYAGRRDLSDLKQAYLASSDHAKQLATQLQQSQVQMAELQARLTPPPRPTSPYEELEQIGVPSNPLRQAIASEIQEAFRPIARQIEGQNQARTHMLTSYGEDYTKFEQDVAKYIQADQSLSQRYNAMFAQDPVAAVEYAFLKYGETKRRENPSENGAIESKHQQARAQVPTSRSSESRNPEGGNRSRVERAFEAFQKNPNRHTAEAFAKSRFATVITDEHLNQ